MTGDSPDDLFVLIQHHVQQKVDADDRAGFLDILPDRVAGKPAGAGGLLHHAAVIVLDGRRRGAAGHDRLGSAGVAGKVVVLHVA